MNSFLFLIRCLVLGTGQCVQSYVPISKSKGCPFAAIMKVAVQSARYHRDYRSQLPTWTINMAPIELQCPSPHNTHVLVDGNMSGMCQILFLLLASYLYSSNRQECCHHWRNWSSGPPSPEEPSFIFRIHSSRRVRATCYSC